MILYRLTRKAYIDDISGRGAETHGGRWNNKGLPALYTASSRALAVLEVAVHVPLGIIPIDYFMCGIELPDGISIFEIKPSDLPKKWNSNPIIQATQMLGDDFLKGRKHLAMKIPSASVSGDFNYILNPAHPGFNQIKVAFTEPFEFDSRLFKM